MFMPERLGNVTVPANRHVRGENFGKLLRPELVPLLRLVLGSQKGGSMIEATQRSKWLMAINTLLSFIPMGNNIPQEAVLRVGLELLQALLTAIMPFWPARASI